ncbi:MAG: hypothetical protein M3290_01555 [Actinomycetota bacterium]|nr:hypothetical protein [Actinomycetota bacterium]
MSNEISLAEFLIDTWLPACEPTVRPTTFVSYAGHVRLHIIPHLGDIPLGELTPQHLNRLYAELRARGRLNRQKGLSPATVRLVHTTLRRALKDAVRWGYRADSPADGADAPRMRAGDWIEMKTWTADQLRTFLSFVKDDPLYPLWHMYAMTGMRRGELLGLRWSDVDLPAARLAVRQTVVVLKGKFISSQPKTARGRRVIALDPGTVEVL